jgi:hypothetical protein
VESEVGVKRFRFDNTPGLTQAELEELNEALDDVRNSATAAGMDCEGISPEYRLWEDEVGELLLDAYRKGHRRGDLVRPGDWIIHLAARTLH